MINLAATGKFIIFKNMGEGLSFIRALSRIYLILCVISWESVRYIKMEIPSLCSFPFKTELESPLLIFIFVKGTLLPSPSPTNKRKEERKKQELKRKVTLICKIVPLDC